MDSREKIAVLGLGYVGLPLAIEFAKKFEIIGFDVNPQRVAELNRHHDSSLEVSSEEISASTNLTFTSDPELIRDCSVYIVAVPTPIDKSNHPDFAPLVSASDTVGKVLSAGNLVVYESTVFPGATEEICVPILEERSGLTFNRDFFCGYSPERINPGDKNHRISSIRKITSGSTPEAAERVDSLYRQIITAGTHKAQSMKVAEAAKVIENIQRDVNIALVNELAVIFEKLGIDTEEVLEAAGTKWNFLPFRPGLVGGHCIGVDPYYLTYKAAEVGHHPEMVLAGRRVNDGMGQYVCGQIIKAMNRKHIPIVNSRVLVMGLAFKENCPDIRNSKVVDVVSGLVEWGCLVDVYDPWVDADDAMRSYGLSMIDAPQAGTYDAIVLAVAHSQFTDMGIERIRALGRHVHVVYDVKYILPSTESDDRL